MLKNFTIRLLQSFLKLFKILRRLLDWLQVCHIIVHHFFFYNTTHETGDLLGTLFSHRWNLNEKPDTAKGRKARRSL